MKNPTYTRIGDHTETIQIDYDPAKCSYEDLLKVFWSSHNPCATPYSRQYRSAVFYHDTAQRKAIEATRKREEKRRGQKIKTAVEPLSAFYLAEDYHQKYYLKQRRELYREYQAIYPGANDFLNSTAVMRVNSYIAGRGSYSQLQSEIEQLGLSPDAQKVLLGTTGR